MHIKRVTVNTRSYSLCSYLDELLEELDSLTELSAEADLGDHPQLNLVEPAQKQVQIGRGSPKVLPAKRVVQKLMLGRGGRRHLGGAGGQLLPLCVYQALLLQSFFLGRRVCATSCIQLKSSQSNIVIW